MIDNGDEINAYHLWDIANDRNYLNNIGDYYNEANVACIVYDITNK